MTLRNYFSVRNLTVTAILFGGLVVSTNGQEATGIQPSVENRLRLETRPQDPADASVGNLNNSGEVSNEVTGEPTASSLRLVDTEIGYAFGVGVPDFDYGGEPCMGRNTRVKVPS